MVSGTGTVGMSGGAGADLFRFDAFAKLAPLPVLGFIGFEDQVFDFSRPEINRIDLTLWGFTFTGLSAGTLPSNNFLNTEILPNGSHCTDHGQTTFILDAAGFSTPIPAGTMGTLFIDTDGDGFVDHRIVTFGGGASIGGFSNTDILLF